MYRLLPSPRRCPIACASDELLFRMLGVIDGNAQSVLFALDAAYKYDDSGNSGKLIDIKGGAEAFFKWNDASAWHLYLGQKEPRERRIRAQIFKIFDANAYFMLDAGKVQIGAYAGYNKSWKFGRLGVEIESWIEGDAVLNWRPAHFCGQLWQHGAARLRAYGFSIGLNVDARLSADIFDPYHIRGQFRVKINLPWPLPDPGATITLEWGPEKQWPALPQPLQEVAIEHLKVTTKWPLAYSALAAEPGGPPNLTALQPAVQITIIGPVSVEPPPVRLRFAGFENRYEIWIALERPAKQVTLKLGEPQDSSHVITRRCRKAASRHRGSTQRNGPCGYVRRAYAGIQASRLARSARS